jgi:putative transposase
VTIRCNNKDWFDLPLSVVWEICLKGLKRAHHVVPVDIQAFVLMSNHYHLLIWTPNADLDKFMFEFNRFLSLEIRTQTGRINRIFGDRYKWSLIQNDSYYFTVEKYIYQNPLAAKIVSRCEDYPYSTLYYVVKNLSFSVPLKQLERESLISENYLNLINTSSNELDRTVWSKALLKPQFKPPKVVSSRRLNYY